MRDDGWQIPGWDDPFHDEQYAQDFADVVALPGHDTYHTDQARNLRWLCVRNDTMRLHSLAKSLEDALADLELDDDRANELDVRIQQVRHALSVATRHLRNPHERTSHE